MRNQVMRVCPNLGEIPQQMRAKARRRIARRIVRYAVALEEYP